MPATAPRKNQEGSHRADRPGADGTAGTPPRPHAGARPYRPRTERPREAAIGRGSLACLALAAPLLGVACWDRNPRQLEATEPALSHSEGPTAPRELSEDEKIARLVNMVRASGRVFLRGRREITAGEFADRLQLTHDRHREDSPSAREIVERATRPDESGRRFRVRDAGGEELQASDWLHDQLDAVERAGAQGAAHTPHATPSPGPRGVTVARLLGFVSQSGRTFVVPERKGPPRTLGAEAFADLLQKKWRWLGPDIEDPQVFVRELATAPFITLSPYRVRQPDGTEEDVATWLRRELAAGRLGTGPAAPAAEPSPGPDPLPPPDLGAGQERAP